MHCYLTPPVMTSIVRDEAAGGGGICPLVSQHTFILQPTATISLGCLHLANMHLNAQISIPIFSGSNAPDYVLLCIYICHVSCFVQLNILHLVWLQRPFQDTTHNPSFWNRSLRVWVKCTEFFGGQTKDDISFWVWSAGFA